MWLRVLTSPRGPEFCSKYLGGGSQSFIIKVMQNPALSSHIYISFTVYISFIHGIMCENFLNNYISWKKISLLCIEAGRETK